jgi:hypothetical protein
MTAFLISIKPRERHKTAAGRQIEREGGDGAVGNHVTSALYERWVSAIMDRRYNQPDPIARSGPKLELRDRKREFRCL